MRYLFFLSLFFVYASALKVDLDYLKREISNNPQEIKYRLILVKYFISNGNIVDAKKYLEAINEGKDRYPLYKVNVKDGSRFVYSDEELSKYEEEEDVVEIFETYHIKEIGKNLKNLGVSIKEYVEEREYLLRNLDTKEELRCKNLKEVLEEVRKEAAKGINIQRYKGLGEMNPSQLWESTMNPKTRTLIKVTLEDAVEADRIFTILMGDNPQPRREFIQAHAHEVKNLDI